MSSTFRQRLLEAMEIRNMTQADLVKASGLSKPRISQYVNGAYEAKQQALYALSEALKVNVSWLMGNDVPMEIDYDKLRREVNAHELIEETYGKEAFIILQLYFGINPGDRQKSIEAYKMYIHLDADDQGEIRGEMKQMLKAEKYLEKDGQLNNQAI